MERIATNGGVCPRRRGAAQTKRLEAKNSRGRRETAFEGLSKPKSCRPNERNEKGSSAWKKGCAVSVKTRTAGISRQSASPCPKRNGNNDRFQEKQNLTASWESMALNCGAMGRQRHDTAKRCSGHRRKKKQETPSHHRKGGVRGGDTEPQTVKHNSGPKKRGPAR